MDISIFNRTNTSITKYSSYFNKIAKNALKVLRKEDTYVVSVTFVRSCTIHKLNFEYRGIDRPTDVITFAYQDSDFYDLEDVIDLGDIFINVDYAKRQAREYGHSYDREICFLFTHGLLHCFGYDHMNPKEEKEMVELQDKILDPIIKREK